MNANMQLLIDSFRQLFPDKIFSLTFGRIPDISLTAVKIPDISRFSIQVVTLHFLISYLFVEKAISASCGPVRVTINKSKWTQHHHHHHNHQFVMHRLQNNKNSVTVHVVDN